MMSAVVNRASKYVVREAWVEVDTATGSKSVVLEIQGISADENYWVTGFQIRIPFSRYVVMTVEQLNGLIAAKIIENENALDKSLADAYESALETEKIKRDAKFVSLQKDEYGVDGRVIAKEKAEKVKA